MRSRALFLCLLFAAAGCGGSAGSHGPGFVPAKAAASKRSVKPADAACPAPAQAGNDVMVNPASGAVATFTGLSTAATSQVVLVTTTANATFTAPANFTLLRSAQGWRSAAVYVSSTNLSANPQFTASGGQIAGVAVAYSGTSGVVDASSLATAAPSNVGQSGAITPTQANDVFSLLAMNDATTRNVSAPPQGFTEASVAGGATGSVLSERDYYLLDPALTSMQPAVGWNYGASGNETITSYVLLKPQVCATPTPTPTPTPMPGAIALVQAVVAAPTGQPASTTATLPNPPVQGDLLTACASVQDNDTIPAPAGWSALESITGAGGGLSFYVFYKIAGANEPRALTITPSTADWQSLSVREYSGENAASPFGGFASAAAASVSATPTVAGTLPTSCFTMNTQAGATAHTAGANEDYSAWPSTVNGNGYQPPYNAAEGQTGPIIAGTSAYTSSVTWNLTPGNGPKTMALLAFIAPAASGGSCCTTAVEWPVGFEPYAASSLWNTRITNPDNPTIYGQSAAIMANVSLQSNGTPLSFHTDEYGNSDATFHPVVFASTSDPYVSVQCTLYCNGWGSGGVGLPSKMYVPKAARPATGSDHHLAVVQPNGEEYDMWYVKQDGSNTWLPPGANSFHDWTSSDTISVGNGQDVGNFSTGSGQETSAIGNAATAGGAALAAGMVRESELAAGQIDHALFLASQCVGTSYVYPAIQGGDNVCSGGGAQMIFGAHLWTSLTDAQIDALTGATADQKTILHALHDYGGYVMDSGGSTQAYTMVIGIQLESGAAFAPFGVTPPMDTYAASHGWPTQTIQIPEHYLNDGSGINWSATLQILDPCYASKTC